MERASQGDQISIELHQVPAAGDWLVLKRPNSPLFDWDADLTAPLCVIRDRDLRHNAIAHVSTKPPRKPDSALTKKRQACSDHVLSLLAFPHRAWHDRPTEVWILHGKDTTPEACDFAFTSCLHPATRNAGLRTISTQNPAEYEKFKRTCRDTAKRPRQNGLRCTPVGFWWPCRRLGRLSTQTGHLDLPPTQHHLSPHIERHHTRTGSAHLLVTPPRLCASHFATCPYGCLDHDDWWPAWDEPDSDAWSTDYDSLAEMSDDATVTWSAQASGYTLAPLHFPFCLLRLVSSAWSSFVSTSSA